MTTGRDARLDALLMRREPEVLELDDDASIESKLDRVIVLLELLVEGKPLPRPKKTPAQLAHDLAVLRSMRAPTQEPGEYPTTTTTREKFFDPRYE